MNHQSHRHSFTLIELLVSLIAAAMLALTAGLMVFFGYRTWQRNQEIACLQEDAAAALATVSQVLRGAVAADVSVSAGQITVKQRDGNGTVTRTARIFTSGRNLVYRPDITATTEAVLVKGRLDSFAPQLESGRVSFILVMSGKGRTMAYDSVRSFRN